LSNQVWQSGGVIETKIMTTMTNNQQLELGFHGPPARLFGRRRETRVARAQWWFAQMRAAVAGAMDWPATGQPTGEPIAFPSAHRPAKGR
jgi:hypothetical protein